MSKNRSRVSFRKELSYLADAAETFETEKRNAKAEALRKATLQVAAMRQDLAKLIWESINVNGATIADVSTVSGYSRATVYRFLDEHVENTGGNPGALLDAVKSAQMQKRFVFKRLGDVETQGDYRMMYVLDTATGSEHLTYFDKGWSKDWVVTGLGSRGKRSWVEHEAHAELELLVSMIENGSFVPADLVAVLDDDTRERIAGADTGTPSSVRSFDDWDL